MGYDPYLRPLLKKGKNDFLSLQNWLMFVKNYILYTKYLQNIL
jgi:hypothetical protein